MIQATLDMLRARDAERVALVGVICAVMSDDLADLPRRLECVRDSAREFARTQPRKSPGPYRRKMAEQVASIADDLLTPVQQMVDRDPIAKA